MFCYPKKKWLTLGARDFSCAVSGLGQKKKTTVTRTWYTAADTEASCRTREKTSGTQDRSGLASTPVIYLVKWAQKIMGTEAPYNVQSNDKEFVTINNEPPLPTNP